MVPGLNRYNSLRRRWQTPVLALLTTGSFVYAAVAVFDVPWAAMLDFFLLSLALVGMAASLAAVVVILRQVFRR